VTKALIFDLQRCALVIIVSALLGWALGSPMLGLAIALAILLIRQLHSTWLLHRRLQGRKAPLAHRRGVLGELESHLDHIQQQARKRKKQLAKVEARFR
jgi:hypothetical protein